MARSSYNFIFLGYSVASPWALCLIVRVVSALLVLLFGAVADLPGILILVLMHRHHLHLLSLKLSLYLLLRFQIRVQLLLLRGLCPVLKTPLLVHDLHPPAHISMFEMSPGVRADVPILVDRGPKFDTLIEDLSDLFSVQLICHFLCDSKCSILKMIKFSDGPHYI